MLSDLAGDDPDLNYPRSTCMRDTLYLVNMQ